MDLADAHAKAYYMGRGEDTRKKLQAAIAAEHAAIRAALQDYNNPAAPLAVLVDILVTGVRQELQAKENYRHDLEMTERQRDAALTALRTIARGVQMDHPHKFTAARTAEIATQALGRTP